MNVQRTYVRPDVPARLEDRDRILENLHPDHQLEPMFVACAQTVPDLEV